MFLACLAKRVASLSFSTGVVFALGACGQSQHLTPDGGPPGPMGGGGSDIRAGGTGGKGAGSDIAVPSGSGGEGGGTGGTTIDVSVIDNCARTEVTAGDTTIVQPADIIILVDSSPSMLEEIGFVRDNLNAFSAQIVDSGVDARVIMIAEPIPADVPEDMRDTVTGICIDPPLGSGSCPDDTSLPDYVHIPQPVGSTDSLDVLMMTKDQWLEYARPEALTAIFIVSDGDAAFPKAIIYGDPPRWEDIDFMSNTFFERFDRLDPELLGPWSLNAVFPFSECAYAERTGKLYQRLVDMTGGIAGDLCEQDFQTVFDRLAARVVDDAVALSCEWEIPDPIEGQTFSTELVKVSRTSAGEAGQELLQVPTDTDCVAGAWYFDDPANPSRILACPQTCDAISDDTDGRIDVVFGCELVEGCSATSQSTLQKVSATSDDSASSMQVECEWPIPEAGTGGAVDLDTLNVRYLTQSGFGILLGQVENAEACTSVAQGWYYDSPKAPTSIVVCPHTCETLQSAEVKEVEALLGCETKSAEIVK